MIRYWPVSSVDALRTFSMSTGLVASTVTQGNTAPDVSRTTPVIDDCCARLSEEVIRSNAETPVARVRLRIRISFLLAVPPSRGAGLCRCFYAFFRYESTEMQLHMILKSAPPGRWNAARTAEVPAAAGPRCRSGRRV